MSLCVSYIMEMVAGQGQYSLGVVTFTAVLINGGT